MVSSFNSVALACDAVQLQQLQLSTTAVPLPPPPPPPPMDATAARAFASPLVLILLPSPMLTASLPAFLFKVEVLLSIDVLFDARRVLFWQRSNP
jgi:hypothetical protein